MIRVLVVDDEPIARRRILRMLAAEPDVEVVGECGSGADAVLAIAEQAPDLVFLDVQMPGLDGFGVLDAVGARAMPQVVFVTAFEEYAIRAFDVHALDYLLKPFGAERFRESLQRARARLAERGAERLERLAALLDAWRAGGAPTAAPQPPSRERYLERLMVKTGGRYLFLRVGEVRWIEAEGNYLRLHVEGRSYLMRETMAALEARLDPDRFLRIHRSTIVNLDRVKEMRPWFAGDHLIVLDDGAELKVGRGYRARLRERAEPSGG